MQPSRHLHVASGSRSWACAWGSDVRRHPGKLLRLAWNCAAWLGKPAVREPPGWALCPLQPRATLLLQLWSQDASSRWQVNCDRGSLPLQYYCATTSDYTIRACMMTSRYHLQQHLVHSPRRYEAGNGLAIREGTPRGWNSTAGHCVMLCAQALFTTHSLQDSLLV